MALQSGFSDAPLFCEWLVLNLIGNRFHIFIHARPARQIATSQVELDGVLLRTLQIDPTELTEEHSATFEHTLEVLTKLPRSYVEPDGAFFWRPEPRPDGSFVEGNIFDGIQTVQHMELKGNCSIAEFDQVTGSLGTAKERLVIQMLPYAIFVDYEQFSELLK